jgi:protein TonB
MKTCPKCGAQYDNETLLFCTRDGTPLVQEGNGPEFTGMPSESWEEDTVVISKPAAEAKIIVPTSESEAGPEVVPVAPPRSAPPYQPPPPKPRIALTILLTVLSTIAVVAIAVAVWWGLNGGSANLPANGNFDANLYNTALNNNANMFNMNSNFNMANMNLNANANFNANANLNFNANANVNVNANANVNKPTLTPKATASPKPSETPDENGNDNATPNSSPSTTPKVLDAGMLNSRAISLPRPAYPPAAKTAGVSGSVNVTVLVDEQGNVTSAKAVSGHPLLRPAAEAAARQARFNPPKMDSQPVKMTGTLLYSF